MKKLLKSITPTQTPRSLAGSADGRSSPQSAPQSARSATSEASSHRQTQHPAPVGSSNMASPRKNALSPRGVMQNYGSHLSAPDRDARLEATINGAMDYLANEGLTVTGLLKERAPGASVHKTMVGIFSGQDPDFVSINNAPLATAVLEECLIRMSEAVFPWRLVDPLSDAIRQSLSDPPDRAHVRMQDILLEAVRQNAVSPIFLNLLGLLNLIVQHAGENGCTLQVAADAFAARMLENFGNELLPDSREFKHGLSKASAVMAQLIDKVYIMFPQQDEAQPLDSSAPPAHQQVPTNGPAVPASAVPLSTNVADGTVRDPSPAASEGGAEADTFLSAQFPDRDTEASMGAALAQDEEDEEEDEEEPCDLWAVALYAYTATEDDELTFSKGDRMHLDTRTCWDHETGQGWYHGTLANGESGQLPSTHIKLVPEEAPSGGASADTNTPAAPAAPVVDAALTPAAGFNNTVNKEVPVEQEEFTEIPPADFADPPSDGGVGDILGGGWDDQDQSSDNVEEAAAPKLVVAASVGSGTNSSSAAAAASLSPTAEARGVPTTMAVGSHGSWLDDEDPVSPVVASLTPVTRQQEAHASGAQDSRRMKTQSDVSDHVGAPEPVVVASIGVVGLPVGKAKEYKTVKAEDKSAHFSASIGGRSGADATDAIERLGGPAGGGSGESDGRESGTRGVAPEFAQLEALLKRDPFAMLDLSNPVVPPLKVAGGLESLNAGLRAAWDDALNKYQSKGVASKHRTAIPGKDATARPKSARAASRYTAGPTDAKASALTERLTRSTVSAKIKHAERLKRAEDIRAQAASHASTAFQLYSRPDVSPLKKPVYAHGRTPTADGLFRSAKATDAAKAAAQAKYQANGRVHQSGAKQARGAKYGQEERPWRKVPAGWTEKGKPKSNPVPKFVDPDVTLERWKKRWELKILNDPDLKVMRVRLGENLNASVGPVEDSENPSRTPSPAGRSGRAFSPAAPEAEASVQALSAVHLIRENQRARIKAYNQGLVAAPVPTSARGKARDRTRASSRASSTGRAYTPERSRAYTPERARRSEDGVGGWIRDGQYQDIRPGDYKSPAKGRPDSGMAGRMNPKHETASFDAATRHIARQRAAMAAREQRFGSAFTSPHRRSMSAEQGRRHGYASERSNDAHTPELSKAMRAAGTARNAKRGVKDRHGAYGGQASVNSTRSRHSPDASVAPGLGDKFHMLEAHLRKSSALDASGASEGEDATADASRVEYLFKADAPVHGMPHTSSLSSAAVVARQSQARQPPASVSPPKEVFSAEGSPGDSVARRRSGVARGNADALDETHGPLSDHVILLQEEDDTSVLAQMMVEGQSSWPLVEAVGLVGLDKGPLEPLLAAHMAAGLEHALLNDPHFVDGPYKPQLIALEAVGTLPLPREALPVLVMPCGALVWRKERVCEGFSSLLPQGNGAGVYLHCLLRYREEPSEGVWLPQCLFIASRWAFHSTFAHVLRLYAEGSGPGADAWGQAHVQSLAACLAVDAPSPGRPLYLQVRDHAVHLQRPAARDLPVADIDFGVLLSALDLTSIQRILVLLLLGEARVLVVADDADVLFPIIFGLTALLYPFTWRHTLIPHLPATYLMELDAPFPFLLGITRPALPRGRVPPNVCQVDATHKSLSVPPQMTAIENSEAGRQLMEILGAAFAEFAADVGRTRGGGEYETQMVLSAGVQAPGAWGNSSAGDAAAQLHGSVEALRNSLCSRLSAVIFRYPLFVQGSGGAVQAGKAGGRRSSSAAAAARCVKLDLGGLMCASECPHLLAALGKTQILRHLVSTSLPQFASLLGAAGEGVAGERCGEEVELDLFGELVMQRLQAESQVVADIQRSGHICGFLFVKDPVKASGEGAEDDDALRWSLKWCELSGLDLKMYVFNSPDRSDSGQQGEEASGHMTLTLRHLRTLVRTLPPVRRDPTALAMEIIVKGAQGGDDVDEVEEWCVKMCAKDEASRTKWLKHVRCRAMGPLALRRLALLEEENRRGAQV